METRQDQEAREAQQERENAQLRKAAQALKDLGYDLSGLDHASAYRKESYFEWLNGSWVMVNLDGTILQTHEV